MSKLTPLGLSEDASPEDVEARYAELTAFLRSKAIPAGLRSWAERQLALLDDYYASGEVEEWDSPPPARARSEPARAQRAARPSPAAARRRAPRSAPDRGPALPQGWLGLGAAGLVAGLVVVAFITGIIFFRSDDGGQGTPSEAGVGSLPLDEARIAELKAVVAAQPDNQDALFEIGERYFEANRFEEAIEWFTKLVALNPTDTHALTDLGTANYNLGRPLEAKKFWEQVLQVDPNDVQAHYNLGFFYANVEPRDLDSAIREWEAVINLDPNSPLAQTAMVHIEGLREQAAPTEPTPEPTTGTP